MEEGAVVAGDGDCTRVCGSGVCEVCDCVGERSEAFQFIWMRGAYMYADELLQLAWVP